MSYVILNAFGAESFCDVIKSTNFTVKDSIFQVWRQASSDKKKLIG